MGFSRALIGALVFTLAFTSHAWSDDPLLLSSLWFGSNGNWTDVVEWSTNPFYPDNGNGGNFTYDAAVGAGTVNLDVDVQIEGLTLLSTAELTGSGDIGLNALSTWTFATLSGTGDPPPTMTINSTGELDILSNVTLNNRSIVNDGTLKMTGPSGARIDMFSGNHSIINNAGGTFTITQGMNINAHGGASRTLENAGQFNPNGDVDLDIQFDNSGTTNVTGGTLDVRAGGSNTGTIDIEGGSTLRLTGGTFTGDGNYTGDGDVVVADGFSPGNSTASVSFGGNLILEDATLTIELGGTTPGTGHDQLVVAGDASLSGTIDLVSLPAYNEPTTDGQTDTFNVIAADSITGTFDQINYNGNALTDEFNVAGPSLRQHKANGVFLIVQYRETDFDFAIRKAVPGDNDGDGDVDTGDITVSIINFTGGSGSGKNFTQGDGDNDGDIDTGDITVSIINFTGGQLAGDPNVPDLIYDPATGEVVIDADAADLISFSLQSGPFNNGAVDFSALPAGLTDNIANQVGWTSFNLFSGLTGSANLGAILPAGLGLAELESMLTTADYGLALAGGGGGGRFEIRLIPEPGSILVMGVVFAIACGRKPQRSTQKF